MTVENLLKTAPSETFTAKREVSFNILSSRKKLNSLKNKFLQRKNAQLKILLHPGSSNDESVVDSASKFFDNEPIPTKLSGFKSNGSLAYRCLKEGNKYEKKEFQECEVQTIKKIAKQMFAIHKDES